MVSTIKSTPTLSSEILASLEEYSRKTWSEPACRREMESNTHGIVFSLSLPYHHGGYHSYVVLVSRASLSVRITVCVCVCVCVSEAGLRD